MKKVRYAVVGLGHIAQTAILPAFEHAKDNSELMALVSSNERKRRELGRKYGVRTLHDYDEFDDLLDSGMIDAIYLATPNSEHSSYAIRAAEAGVHVLCEKPLAVSEEECEAMIEAARANGVKLMTAYRLHFERANLEAIEKIRSGALGDPRLFVSTFSFQVKAGNNRLDASLGGGPLFDIGVYCVNAARYLFGDEPFEVCALGGHGSDPRFAQVHQSVGAVMRFPDDRIASFAVGFGAHAVAAYRLVGTKGELHLDPAYEYRGALHRTATSGGRRREKIYPEGDQFAPEILYFSRCILEDREPEPSGVEGLADVRVIRALLRSLETGEAVALPRFEKGERPSLSQLYREPPVKAPQPIAADAPTL